MASNEAERNDRTTSRKEKVEKKSGFDILLLTLAFENNQTPVVDIIVRSAPLNHSREGGNRAN